MTIQSELNAIRAAGLISEAQVQAITQFLNTNTQPPRLAARFDLTHVLWYAGALIMIGALGLFTTDAFNRLGGPALIACGAAYAVAFGSAGHYLWRAKHLRIPGGLLIAAACAMVPMIVYGIQDWLKLWDYAQGNPGQYRNIFPYIHGSWLYMEIATVIVASLAAWFYRFSFILLIAAIALWFMSMDLAMWFTRSPDSFDDFPIRRTVSLVFGIVMIGVAWIIDLRREQKADMMFWIHIFGVMAFWGGLSLHDGGTLFTKSLYCLINVGLLALSLFLNRRVYAVFGALGIAGYLGYLANDVFKNSILFPFALSLIGLAVIGAGLYVNKNREKLQRGFDRIIPEGLRWLRPPLTSP